MSKTLKQKNNLTIGDLAKKAKINLQTIRYYERLDLLPEPERTEAGYRIYNEDYLKHIKFVKNAQDIGFTLDEIRDLVAVKLNPKAHGKDVKKIIEAKIEDIENQIEELKGTKKYLESLDKSCSGKMLSSCCPIIGILHE